MPLDSVQRLRVRLRIHAEHDAALDVVGDDLRELPNDKATVRGDASETVAVDRHIAHRSSGRKEGRKREKSPVAARTGDDADASLGHRVRNPLSRADGGPRKEGGVDLYERDRRRLHSILRRLNFVEGLRDVEDDRLRRYTIQTQSIHGETSKSGDTHFGLTFLPFGTPLRLFSNPLR